MVISTSSLKQRFLSGSIWAFSGQIATVIFGVLVNALLAHLLSPEELGAYFLIFSVVSFTALLGEAGLNRTVVKLVSESLGRAEPGRAKTTIKLVFSYGSVTVLFVAAFLAFGAWEWIADHVFSSPLMAREIILATSWVIVVAYQDLLAETFRGFQDIRLAVIFKGLAKSVLLTILFTLLWTRQGYSDLSQTLTLTVTVGSLIIIVAVIFLRKKMRSLGNGGGVKSREVLSISSPLLVTNLTMFTLTQASVWILGAFRPSNEVAIYGAAVRLVTLVTISLSIVNAVVPPFISELHATEKKKQLERILRTTATVSGIPAFLALVGLILFGAWVLDLVYGDYYRQGAIILAILSLGQLVNVWTGSCSLTLMMTGHQTIAMKLSILCGVITIIGSILLVGEYGVLGVAGTFTFALILQNVLALLLVKQKVGIWTHPELSMSLFRHLLQTFEMEKRFQPRKLS